MLDLILLAIEISVYDIRKKEESVIVPPLTNLFIILRPYV
jgi:hypothetical protein